MPHHSIKTSLRKPITLTLIDTDKTYFLNI